MCVTNLDSPTDKKHWLWQECSAVQCRLQWPVTGIWLPHTQIQQNLVQFFHPQIPLILGVGTQPVPAQKTLSVQQCKLTVIHRHILTDMLGLALVTYTYLVTHIVFLHWLTSVSLSSSLCGLTVISSNVFGLAQNSLLAGSTFLLVQLARLMRPMGFWQENTINKFKCHTNTDWNIKC